MSGLPCLVASDMDDLAPASTPAVVYVRVPQVTSGGNRLRTFWLEPVSVFGSLQVDDACGSSHVLGMSSSLALRPH